MKEVLVVDATRCHRLVLQKGGVGRFVVLFFTCCYKVEPAAQTFFCNSVSNFCGPGFGAGLLPPADGAAAEWDVAGLGSEDVRCGVAQASSPTFSFQREQLCQDLPFCEEPRPGHRDGSAWFLPCQPGRQCTGPRRSSSFARHDTLASSPELLIKMRLSAGSTGRDVASMKKRLYEQSIDVVLQALVAAR